MNWVSPIKDDETLERFKQALRKVARRILSVRQTG